MKKEFENKNLSIGLEEINQVETSEVNGGCALCIIDSLPPIFCYWNIPPMDRDNYPWLLW